MMMDVQIAWQLLAIWAIVVSTIVWFVRDERRLESERALVRAARYYAHVPMRRQINRPEAIPLPKPRSSAIRHSDRAYFQRALGIEPR
ncbi:hypothetical protein FF80_01732 [Devosia sp. LC5]|uniref:hypothetical protein n=1 Tax=Devosia sp. LC5 TaxID=1502724 RepID=UPI0004E33891|nr:hypothetical protein [Devosia sp. LC5]KFC68778.1 hypothetical protein FF80_01732 [Devosia sp. LC5]